MSEPVIFYSGPIVTRAEAKAQGLKRYFTGVPCNYGHICERYSNDFKCCECSSVFAKKNYNKYKPRITKRVSEWQKNNKEKVKAKAKRHYKKYPEKFKEKLDFLCKNYKTNPETRKRYKKKNRIYFALKQQERRCKIKQTKVIPQDILNLYKQQKAKCVNCMCSIKENYHVDHIMPLALGGSNDVKNLQLLCPRCNCKKHAKHPIDWALENGRLV